MKRMKKIVSLLAAAMLCLMPLANLSLTAHAAEPVTYYLKYLPSDNEWRYQVGSAWDDTAVHRELYYMKLDIKDGDYMVIEGNNDLILDLSVRLGNLTMNSATTPIITAKGIDNLYVLRDSRCIINGDVTNAYIYDNGFCNFNNNVTYLEIIGSSDINATVAAGGTVGHAKGVSNLQTYYDLYNFEAGRLYIENGSVRTEAKYYSTTPQGTQTAPAPAAPAASATPDPAPAAPASSSAAAASGEYDDVPKTGEANTCIWLLGIAAVCLLGRYELNKR